MCSRKLFSIGKEKSISKFYFLAYVYCTRLTPLLARREADKSFVLDSCLPLFLIFYPHRMVSSPNGYSDSSSAELSMCAVLYISSN